MPFNFPIDPYGAPPPAPSPYGQQPSYDLSGLQSLMSSFGDTAQGLIDRNMGNPTQPGMSNDYLKAILSGGTPAMNDRFSAMYAPGRYHDEVAAELANDPVYGGAFQQPQGYGMSQDLGGAQVTQYGDAPADPSGRYQEVAGMLALDHPTGSGGRALGGLAGSQYTPGTGMYDGPQSQALTNRLDDRADREAFNERKFSVSPFRGADPTKVLGMMYEAALAERQMQAQAAELSQKERMARWMGEQEMGYKDRELDLRGRGIDADIANNAAMLGLRQDEFGLNKLKTQAEITALGRENQIASPLNPDQYLTRKAQLEKDYGPVRGAQLFEEEMAALDKRFGYSPPGSGGGDGGLMGMLGGLLGGVFGGGSAESPVSTTGGTTAPEMPNADSLSFLRPKTFSGFKEGFNADSVYADPLANYQDYFANAVPPEVQTRLKAENNAWLPAFAMGDLDQDIAGLRSAEGQPLNPREAGAIRRAIYGNSWTPWVDSMLYEY